MSKKACKIPDDARKKKTKYPKYVCKGCGAEGIKEKHLCKPKKK